MEIVPEAIADAEGNAELNGIVNAHFLAGNARTGVRPLIEQAGKPDVVVVDPPRAGLSQKMVRRVIECDATRIVYVSCNPTTLAPNAAQLVEAGYRLTRVKPVDMFPQTPHIECVALLERTRRPDATAAAGGAPGVSRGFGVAAGLDPEVARPLAARCAELGYGSMWSNDHPGAKGPGDAGGVRRRGARDRARRRRDRARPHAAGRDRRRHRAARPRPRRGSGSGSAPASRRSR